MPQDKKKVSQWDTDSIKKLDGGFNDPLFYPKLKTVLASEILKCCFDNDCNRKRVLPLKRDFLLFLANIHKCLQTSLSLLGLGEFRTGSDKLYCMPSDSEKCHGLLLKTGEVFFLDRTAVGQRNECYQSN